jgi:hypothetical protein
VQVEQANEGKLGVVAKAICGIEETITLLDKHQHDVL